MDRRKLHETLFCILNVIFSIVPATLFYIECAPDVQFVQYIHSLFPDIAHGQEVLVSNAVCVFIRNYLLDAAWSYALVFTLFIFFHINTAGIWKSFTCAVLCGSIMEGLQLTHLVKGTFDVRDIIAELIAALCAVLITLFFFRRMKRI